MTRASKAKAKAAATPAAKAGVVVYKVRIVIGGWTFHVQSSTLPVVRQDEHGISSVEMSLLNSPGNVDEIGFIRWRDVSAVGWRQA